MRLAIMQPYYFPYLGYFQLMAAVDTFVILDDVQFIKKGWIHKNQILVEGQTKPIHMTVDHMSQTRRINEHYRKHDPTNERYQLCLLRHAYQKAPYYTDVMPMLERIIRDKEQNVALYLGNLLREVRDYLELETSFLFASSLETDKSLKREQLVLSICACLQTDHYINAIGGQNLYCKEIFSQNGIQLDFIEMQPVLYNQFRYPFVPNLSIIDVLMFNSKQQIRELLNAYTLV